MGGQGAAAGKEKGVGRDAGACRDPGVAWDARTGMREPRDGKGIRGGGERRGMWLRVRRVERT